MNKKAILIAVLCMLSSLSQADRWVEGVPAEIQKTDYANMNLILIRFETPIAPGSCTTGTGVIVRDANPSSKAALSFALTALASGKKFKCYVTQNNCSGATGATNTYPVCEYYPAIKN